MDPLTLTYRETWIALGISKSTFYALLRTGRLDHLRAPISERFSRLKVEQFVNHPQPRDLRNWRTAS